MGNSVIFKAGAYLLCIGCILTKNVGTAPVHHWSCLTRNK